MKKYNSPKIECAEIIKSGILCESNDGNGMFGGGGKTNPPTDAPRRRVF